ncbi:hypothetical protein PR048_030781 [Dryococelus australis]|uniref:Uncharacterized protein n=1 Tax=Dryococelus australis TaxID=614101 RepID=A0ABQ9G9W0_9NEOP|nr:hypothetical protein PR048_030781 [Dryococelus australis]
MLDNWNDIHELWNSSQMAGLKVVEIQRCVEIYETQGSSHKQHTSLTIKLTHSQKLHGERNNLCLLQNTLANNFVFPFSSQYHSLHSQSPLPQLASKEGMLITNKQQQTSIIFTNSCGPRIPRRAKSDVLSNALSFRKLKTHSRAADERLTAGFWSLLVLCMTVECTNYLVGRVYGAGRNRGARSVASPEDGALNPFHRSFLCMDVPMTMHGRQHNCTMKRTLTEESQTVVFSLDTVSTCAKLVHLHPTYLMQVKHWAQVPEGLQQQNILCTPPFGRYIRRNTYTRNMLLRVQALVAPHFSAQAAFSQWILRQCEKDPQFFMHKIFMD